MKTASFKLIFRNWRRNKMFAVISILSLAVGIACTNLLAAFVIHEYNVEAGNPNRERIQMLYYISPSNATYKATPPFSIFSQITEQLPEIENYTMIREGATSYCKVGEHSFSDFKLLESDTGFVHVFPPDEIAGSLETVLRTPDQVAITASYARRLFGETDPMGQAVQIYHLNVFGPDFKSGLYTYTVGAILKNRPQSALTFDAIAACTGERRSMSVAMVTSRQGVSPQELEEKINSLKLMRVRDQLVDIQLASLLDGCFDSTQNINSLLTVRQTGLLQIALISALFILIIACFNYINLSFSRIVQQLQTIHVQKLMGAGNKRITGQLFADTCTMVFIAFLLSILIQHDLLPVFNNVLSVHMPGSFFYSGQVLPVTVCFTLLLSIIPAVYISRKLSRLSLSEYKLFFTGKGKQRIITLLATIQFVISIGLITASISVRQQLTLLEDKIKDQVDVYTMGDGNPDTPLQPFKERIKNLPGVAAVSVGDNSATTPAILSISGDMPRSTRVICGDEDLISSLNLRQVAGIPWEEAIQQFANPVFVQENYAREIYPADTDYPIGHYLREYDDVFRFNYNSEIITIDSTLVLAGVVSDFFNATLSSPLRKSVFVYQHNGNRFLQVRLHPASATSTLNQIKSEWDKLYPGKTLEITSVYDHILKNNSKTTDMADLLLMYSLISICLTCFGLFGMTLYVTEQRTKEIGIRKVNGSTTGQIMWIFIRQFIYWIILAFFIATPLTWYLMGRWLETFTYRVDMTIGICILAGLIVTIITLLTVNWHSYKAASGNPVNALRSE